MGPTPGAWIEAGTPALVLAPMEGVADGVMRALLSELGGFTFAVAEFLRIHQFVPGPRIFREHVPELMHEGQTPTGLPVQVQLLGGDSEKLALAARAAVEVGAKAVDLNFGCPARTVNAHDGGATLLKYPNRVRAIVTAVRAAVPPHLPVSAKLRLGWDDVRAIHVNAERAVDGGANWITVHARTKAQGYRPPAYWKAIGEVRAQLPVPVVANGEIWGLDDLRRCRDETGCEHFMLGRGALACPTLARAAARELGLPSATPPVATQPGPLTEAPAEWLPLISRYVELSTAWGLGPAYLVPRIKQWLRMANHHGGLAWSTGLLRLHGLGELLGRLQGLAAEGEPGGLPAQSAPWT